MTWDILVCSIWHRTTMLAGLLAELERQAVPGVRVLVCWDNLQAGYGEKCQRLLDKATGEYVCFIDDDDWIARDYVERIAGALEQKPDYVGFNVRYTEDGVLQQPVEHSLRNDGWRNDPDRLYRDIVHFNPIRREIALQARWEGGNGADWRWANRLRTLKAVAGEVFIDAELYHYRHRMSDTFEAPREPLSAEPVRPECPRVVWL